MKYKKNEKFYENATNITASGFKGDGGPYPPTLFQAQLGRLGACSEGRKYVGNMTAREFWERCDKPGYMMWLYDHLRNPVDGDKGGLFTEVVYSCSHIRKVLPFEALRALSEGK